jgi:hypothetical protein
MIAKNYENVNKIIYNKNNYNIKNDNMKNDNKNDSKIVTIRLLISLSQFCNYIFPLFFLLFSNCSFFDVIFLVILFTFPFMLFF